jgi:hypothetical protein
MKPNDELVQNAKKLYEGAKADLVESVQALSELERKRAELEERISQLRKLMVGLEPMLAGEDVAAFIDSAFPDVGLKSMCIGVLQATNKALTPSEILRELRDLFHYDVDKYSNPTAVITTTLKRMVESGEAIPRNRDGRTVYALETGLMKSLKKLSEGHKQAALKRAKKEE